MTLVQRSAKPDAVIRTAIGRWDARRTAAACGRALITVAALLAIWLIVFGAARHTRVVPSPLAVWHALTSGWRLDLSNAGVTLRETLVGYLWGNALAIVAGVCFVRWRIAERVLMPFAVGSYCVPLVAVAPILIIVLPDSGPREALAALAVFFTTLISVMVGLRSSDAAATDLAYASGARPWQTIRYIKLPAAMPSLLGGLSIAAPAAMLGAVVGEYLGANSGLGVALLQAQASFEVANTYALALLMAAIAGGIFLVLHVLTRLLVPWGTQQMSAGTSSANGGGQGQSRASSPAWLVLSVVLVVAGWTYALRLFHLSSYFAKSPFAVLEYLTWGTGAAAHRSTLFHAFVTTAGDAVPGYLAGTVLAAGLAVVVVNVAMIRRLFMPVAIALRSIPLVALVPVITLVFGTSVFGVTVLVGLVVFFPTLVNVVVGLNSAPTAGSELVTGLGGSRLDIVARVQLRYALPAFFASARIAIPAALGGATIAEWLATGTGLGNLLVVSSADSEYTLLWSGAVALVVVAVACYELLGLLERVCLCSQAPVYAA